MWYIVHRCCIVHRNQYRFKMHTFHEIHNIFLFFGKYDIIFFYVCIHQVILSQLIWNNIKNIFRIMNKKIMGGSTNYPPKLVCNSLYVLHKFWPKSLFECSTELPRELIIRNMQLSNNLSQTFKLLTLWVKHDINNIKYYIFDQRKNWHCRAEQFEKINEQFQHIVE